MGEFETTVYITVDEDIPCPLCVEHATVWASLKRDKLGIQDKVCPVCNGTGKYHVLIEDYEAETTVEIEPRERYAPKTEYGANMCRKCGRDLPKGFEGKCPECGTEIRFESPVVISCPLCGWWGTKEETKNGKCPNCSNVEVLSATEDKPFLGIFQRDKVPLGLTLTGLVGGGLIYLYLKGRNKEA